MRGLKYILAVCFAVALAVQTALPSYAENYSVLDEIFADSAASRSADSFFDNLEVGQADWLALCRLRLHSSEGGEFLTALSESTNQLAESEGFVHPTELQRAAIILSFGGRCDSKLINAAVYCNENFDRQGINAYIWGLIAANCCNLPEPQGAVRTKASIAKHLLSLQLADGGFALKGESADTDITAGVIYALAPLVEDEEVAAALKKAEQCLENLQLDSGGYMTVGVENCESAAQVVIAFTALGFDKSDSRVAAAYNAMMGYKTADGFSHTSDGKTSGVATVQAAQALAALELSDRGERLFDKLKAASEEGEKPAESEAPSETEAPEAQDSEQPSLNGGQIKTVLLAVLFGGAMILAVVFLATGRKKTALLWAGVIYAAAGVVLLFVELRTADEYYGEQSITDGITVTVTADCGNALLNMERIDEGINPKSVIPADGVVLYPCEVTVPEGSNAFDALIAAAKKDKVQVDYNGSSYGVYINSIGYVYEFGFGSTSGWLFRVNDGFPQSSAGTYTLSEGDYVEFIYTCDLGDVSGFIPADRY